MVTLRRMLFWFLLIVIFMTAGSAFAAAQQETADTEEKPTISLSEDMGQAVMREASKVKEELKQQTRSMFEREPLGWDRGTLRYLYETLFSLPGRIPAFIEDLEKQGRVLGAVGSLLMLLFLAAILYSLLGRNRVLQWAEIKAQPLGTRIPETGYPFFQSALRVLVSALIPLALIGLYALIQAMIRYDAAWFKLTGRLLGLWAAGALLIRLLKEALTQGLFAGTSQYGKTLFRWTRVALFYAVVVIAVFWAAEAFQIRKDVLALLRFAASVSIILVLFQLFCKKKAFLSLLPDLPYGGYRVFVRFLNTYYYPLIMISFLAALGWCFGYRNIGRTILMKIWFTTGAFIILMLLYHGSRRWLNRWAEKLDTADEAAQFLYRSLRSLLLYATVVASIVVVLNLLGLLNPLERIMSFPIFQLGETPVSLWTIVTAVLILIGFIFASRLLQAYFDYKVYPSLGIDPGLGYALNTFFKYTSLLIGLLISLRIVGIDLRFLLVFAGAIGIGIGLGLQNMAANVISGFIIIFGGKIRKGDWVEVGDTLGVVTDIYLRATKVRTRDNIEYLIPNSDLISNTIINYSLSSPMIRIDLPVGVSYGADPHEVREILLDVAKKEPLVSKYRNPIVRFMEYGDSALNFHLLFWIDVRDVPRRKVRSALYFSIFDAFKTAGIEIPFPQRDIHIRSNPFA